MIYLIISKFNESIYNKYISDTINHLRLGNFVGVRKDDYRVINVEEGSSIYEKYNRGIEISNIENEINNDDIYLFAHEDIIIKDSYFFEKCKALFKSHPKLGILGIAGTRLISEAGGWWLNPGHTLGKWQQEHPNGYSNIIEHRNNFPFDSLISVDGCCLVIKGEVLKNIRFDEDTFSNSWHFYDVDICFQAKEIGYNIGFIDSLVHHASEGPLNSDWYDARSKFLNKWKSKGYAFPITTNNF